jgi:hypothetical protein
MTMAEYLQEIGAYAYIDEQLYTLTILSHCHH